MMFTSFYKKPFGKIFLVTVYFVIISFSGKSQNTDTTSVKPVVVEIEKRDATVLRGKLLGVVRDSVHFIDERGNELRIALKEIRNIEYQNTAERKNRWSDSPNTTRYLLTSTATPLKKKEIVLAST